MAKTGKRDETFVWGTGRRKSAVARVRLKSGGSGKVTVNSKPAKDYFTTLGEQKRVSAPLVAVGEEKKWDVFITTQGGGIAAQSGAISLGIARALIRVNPDLEHTLREGKYLTRDDRQKERKKYGRRGARRGFQFSKR